jgi:hypothetical protein
MLQWSLPVHHSQVAVAAVCEGGGRGVSGITCLLSPTRSQGAFRTGVVQRMSAVEERMRNSKDRD